MQQVESYLPHGVLGRMRMSYLGSVFDRSSRASTGVISAFISRTPSTYSPANASTVGDCPFHVIRLA